MPDEVAPERIAIMAAAARVRLEAASVARIARAVSPTVARLADAPVDFPFETEPASFLVVQRRERDR